MIPEPSRKPPYKPARSRRARSGAPGPGALEAGTGWVAI